MNVASGEWKESQSYKQESSFITSVRRMAGDGEAERNTNVRHVSHFGNGSHRLLGCRAVRGSNHSPETARQENPYLIDLFLVLAYASL